MFYLNMVYWVGAVCMRARVCAMCVCGSCTLFAQMEMDIDCGRNTDERIMSTIEISCYECVEPVI